MVKKTLRAGIIGAGGISGAHLNSYKETGTEIMAVADIDKKAAESVAKKYKIPYIFCDYRKLLELKDLDAVSVCLPVFLHARVSIDALEAGKHVLVEKPVAMNSNEAKKMVAAAKSVNKVFAYCGSRFRYRTDVQMAKKIISSRKLGEIYRVRCNRMRHTTRPGIEYQPHTTWWLDKKKAGGGSMVDLGVYDLDVVMWLVNWPEIDSVYGYTYRGINPPAPAHLKHDVEEHAVGIVKCKNGMLITIEESSACQMCPDKKGESQQHDLLILGSNAGIRMNPLTLCTHKNKKLVSNVYKEGKKKKPQNNVVIDFVNKIRGKKTPLLSTPRETIRVSEIIDAIYKSAEQNREIKFIV